MGQDAKLSLPELDVFRGLAALFMVVNHAGVRLWAGPDASQGWGAMVLLVSSYAPALFFFATGVGIGLRGSSRPRDLPDTLYKAVLLVVADQLFFWRVGVAAGLDFFSFIALAMLIVSLLALAARPVVWALVLFVAIVLLRYVAGPFFKDVLPQTGWIAAVVGVHGQPGVSYPISPWLCFPLAGFVLGHAIQARHRAGGIGTQSIRAFVAFAAVFGALGAGLLAQREASFHRWGTVALAFFVLSAAVLGVAWLLAHALTSRHGLPWRGLAVRGVAAFLVVPVHYLLLELLAGFGHTHLSSSVFVPVVVSLCVLTLTTSKVLERGILQLCNLRSSVVPAAVALTVLAGVAATIRWGSPGNAPAFAAATVAQVLLAYGLGKRLSVRERLPAPALSSDAR